MRNRTGIAFIVVVIAGFVLFAFTTPAKPKVGWNPEQVKLVEMNAVVAGESVMLPISFSTTTALTDLEIRVVPELAPLVSVEPGTLPEVLSGEAVSLVLSIAPPQDFGPGIYEGTVQLRSAGKKPKNHAKPLPVKVEVVWPSFENDLAGLTFTYPPEFVLEDFGLSEKGDSQLIGFRDEESGQAMTLEWRSGYVEGLSILDWADEGGWPSDDGDWRGVYEIVTINGIDMLQNKSNNSVIFAVEDRLYHFFNGVGIEPTFVDRDVFQNILESLQIIDMEGGA